MYALNLSEDGRYLSSCDSKIWCPEGAPVVDALPTGETDAEKNLRNWLYVDGAWVYDPLPEPEQPEAEVEPTVWDELDAAYQAGYQEGVDSV